MKISKREETLMVRMTVRVPEALAEKVKIRAIREKISLQELVKQALKAYLRKAPRPKEGQP